MSFRRLCITFVFVASLLAGAPSATAAPKGAGEWPSTAPAPRQHPKLAPALDDQAHGLRPASEGTSPDASGRIVVAVYGPSSSDIAAAVEQAQGTVRTEVKGFDLAWVPAGNLGPLSDDRRVTSVEVPHLLKSTATSEGVAQIGAAAWQNSGVTGSGVKVGVVDVGFTNLSSEQTAGHLPAVTTRSFCTNGIDGSTNHGTAVAEIVHQTAPNAQLFLVCVTFDADIVSAEQYLATQGVTVVNASITSVLSSRGDGTGPVANAMTAGRNAGQLWSVAAGNDGDRHFAFTAVDNDGDSAVEFAPGASFGPDPSEYFTFTLPSNGTINLGIKYDAWPITNQEFQVCVWAGAVPSGSPINNGFCQSGGQASAPHDPTTGYFLQNLPAGQYVLAILRVGNTTISPRMDMFFEGNEGNLQRVSAAGSLGDPATSPSVMAVGAYNVNSLSLETFSSQGPTIDGRIKPEIAAPDGVANDIFNPFFGTSAAAPHATGAAALLKQTDPNLTPALLQNALQSEAIDAGQTGIDNAYGSGRLTLQPKAIGGPSAVTVAGQTVIFVRGSDGGLWLRKGDGTWSRLGGYLTSDPDAATMASGRIDVFARGGDNALWHLRSDNAGVSWQPWESLGGIMASGPTAVSWGPNRIDAFVRGGDNALWHRAYTGTWSPWDSLGGGLTADPTVSSWAPNRLDVFIRGDDAALWHIAWTGSSWTGWQGLGGGLGSGPGAVSASVNTIDVFARGNDGALWTRAWNGSTWVNWQPLGGGLVSDPDPAAPTATQVDVVIDGLDGSVWRKSRVNGVWNQSGQPPGWVSLGRPMLS